MKKILSMSLAAMIAAAALTQGSAFAASENTGCNLSNCFIHNFYRESTPGINSVDELIKSLTVNKSESPLCCIPDNMKDEICKDILDLLGDGCTFPEFDSPDTEDKPGNDEGTTEKPDISDSDETPEDKPDIDIPDNDDIIPPQPDLDKPEYDIPEDDDNEQTPDFEIPVFPDQNKPGDNTKPDEDTDEDINDDTSDNKGEYAQFISEIVSLVNKERKANGLSAVTASNSKLSSAAQKRAIEQASLFSHTRPDGQSWTTVLSEFGVSYRSAGENVAYGQSSAAEVMNAWMNSSGHRENILNPSYTEIGVGVYYKGGTYYWSQLFIS